MHVVFQSETGGFVTFPYTDVPTAMSGYVDVVAHDRRMYRFDGFIMSGLVYVPRADLSAGLPPDQYVLLPQVVDTESRVYYAEPSDLQIIEVPDFQSVVLTPGNSVLVRLNSVESLLRLLIDAGVNEDGTIGVVPTGEAGGDLGGSYPNPDVVRLAGIPIATDVPTGSYLVLANGPLWTGATVTQDAHWHHTQHAPALTWSIAHNLGKRPSVEVYDTAESRLFGAVSYISENEVQITFSTPVNGSAELN